MGHHGPTICVTAAPIIGARMMKGFNQHASHQEVLQASGHLGATAALAAGGVAGLSLLSAAPASARRPRRSTWCTPFRCSVATARRRSRSSATVPPRWRREPITPTRSRRSPYATHHGESWPASPPTSTSSRASGGISRSRQAPPTCRRLTASSATWPAGAATATTPTPPSAPVRCRTR